MEHFIWLAPLPPREKNIADPATTTVNKLMYIYKFKKIIIKLCIFNYLQVNRRRKTMFN